MSTAKCEVCEREKWEYFGSARQPTNCMREYFWCPNDNAAEHWRLGYEREKEIGARLAARTKSLDESRNAAEAKYRDLLLACEEALIWSSAADAFRPDGMASLGWQRVVLPVLEQIRITRGTVTARERETTP